MKSKLIYVSIFAVVLGFIFFELVLSTNRKEQTSIELLTPIIDFGKISYSKKNVITAKIRNTGNADLKIEKISNSCGCGDSIVIYPRISKMKTFELPIEVKPISIGRYLENVFVFCNTDDSPIAITIKGEVY